MSRSAGPADPARREPPRAAAADAIVVAAGASTRMAGIDKAAVPIGGRPLLAWTLAAIAAAPEVERLVVVVAADRVEAVTGAAWLPAKTVAVVGGGHRRQDSVAAGYAALVGLDAATAALSRSTRAGTTGADRVVLVHDGARPLVSPELVGAVALAAAEHGAAIPVLAIAETVKRVAGGIVVETVDRVALATAQTPQGIRRSVLDAAYAVHPPDGEPEFTDEAGLLEACRIVVHAIPGEPSNRKVTVPDDLQRAALGLGVATARFGFGHDQHPFGPGSPLALGGVEIAGAPRLHGHSDGDVALHAVADALLGAAGLGDLGRLFPADDRTPRGVASAGLLQTVTERTADAGYRPLSIDVTIVAARPQLTDHLDAMRAAIAGVVGLDVGAVNVKASTGNLSGDAGAGRGIEAHAVAAIGGVDR